MRPHVVDGLVVLPAAMAEAVQKIEEAIDIWGRCLATGRFPGYPAEDCHVDRPGWDRVKHEERRERTNHVRRTGGDTLKHLIDWQKPLEASNV